MIKLDDPPLTPTQIKGIIRGAVDVLSDWNTHVSLHPNYYYEPRCLGTGVLNLKHYVNQNMLTTTSNLSFNGSSFTLSGISLCLTGIVQVKNVRVRVNIKNNLGASSLAGDFIISANPSVPINITPTLTISFDLRAGQYLEILVNDWTYPNGCLLDYQTVRPSAFQF